MSDLRYKCPSCKKQSLIIDDSGHIICGNLECQNPILVDKLIEDELEEVKER